MSKVGLTRYWFTFKPDESISVLNLGCGVTAIDQTDAMGLLNREVFTTFGQREVDTVVSDIDVLTLDAGHVQPNMGLPNIRGVWFPLTGALS